MFDAHRGAFEYDWRTRFHQPLSEVGRSMSWGEAWRLTRILAADPSSVVGAELAGWDHAVSRESLTLMDTFDLTHRIAWRQGGGRGTRPQPYPRPWPDRSTKRVGNTAGRTRAEVVAILNAHGHALPV